MRSRRCRTNSICSRSLNILCTFHRRNEVFFKQTIFVYYFYHEVCITVHVHTKLEKFLNVKSVLRCIYVIEVLFRNFNDITINGGLSVEPNWVGSTWRRGRNPVFETSCFKWKKVLWIMSIIVRIILIYHRHKPIDSINLLTGVHH
jgi:hypothetical protein